MKNKGFIATSLIYSFFLTFLSIVTVLLSNYIANKTILDRFNDKAQADLNTSSYTISIYSRNANIKDGYTMTNLISNGDFSQNLEFWNISGDALYSTSLWLDNYSVLKSNNNVSNSYLYQNIYVMKDNIYYISLDYLHNSSTNLYSYLGSNSKNSFVIKDNQGITWTRGAVSYRSEFDGYTQYILGDSGNSSYIGNSYFTNALVLNLTASFGLGYEPDVLWVNENISWFDGTISYLNLNSVAYGNDVSIEFTPYGGYNNYNMSCVDSEGRTLSNYSISPINPADLGDPEGDIEVQDENDDEEDKVDIRINRTLNISEVTSNIKCTIEWVRE